eukprot:10018224-Lingulodinium_polyedra.AAC.1
MEQRRRARRAAAVCLFQRRVRLRLDVRRSAMAAAGYVLSAAASVCRDGPCCVAVGIVFPPP